MIAIYREILKIKINQRSRPFGGSRRRLCGALSVCVLITGLVVARVHGQARGITIYRQSSAHSEGSSRVFEYTMIKNKGEVTDYFTTDSQKVTLTKFQPHTSVAYPNLTTMSITSPDQLGPIENGLRVYSDLIERFPQSSRFLNPYIQMSSEMVRRVNSGEIVFNGAWMTGSEYEAMNQREDDLANKFNEQSREKNRAAEETALRLDLETRRRKR